MGILRKNSFAACAMVLMIAVGTLIGSHNTLAGMRRDVAAVFVSGIRGDGIGIQGDLYERESIAYNMVVVAQRYLPADNSLIQNTLAAREKAQAALSIGEKSVADKVLAQAVKDLYEVLRVMDLSAQDEKYPQRLYTDFQSRGDTISHDPYNTQAAAFNKTLAGFPAGLLGGLSGVRPLELF